MVGQQRIAISYTWTVRNRRRLEGLKLRLRLQRRLLRRHTRLRAGKENTGRRCQGYRLLLYFYCVNRAPWHRRLHLWGESVVPPKALVEHRNVAPVMEAFSGLFKTIKSVEHLVSTENEINPPQINTRQCELLAKKASGALLVLQALQSQELAVDGPTLTRNWTPAALELNRVLKDAEIIVRDCCCDGQWLQVAIKRGNLQETFAKLLYDIEWHTSVLCSALTTKSDSSDAFEKSTCEGKLGITEDFMLSSAAKQDRESLLHLLKHSHVCDGEACKPGDGQSCLAVKLLAKLDAEEEELDVSKPPPLLWVHPHDLKRGRGIGKGAFAEVKRTTWLGQSFAIKVFLGGTSYSDVFRREIAVMAGLDHPHVVRVVCCSEDKHNLGIVMELMYKSLFDLLEDYNMGTHAAGATSPFPIIQSVDMMLQIAEGVRYLHSKSLAHRDLKSLNILVQFADPQATTDSLDIVHFTNGTNPFVAKIADFGMTKMKHASTRMANQTLMTGTRAWMAPEVFKFGEIDPSARFHPMKLDVYSFGIMCSEILTGEMPYAELMAKVSPQEFYKLVKDGNHRPKLPKEIPTRLAVMIQRCWDWNPRRRPDFPAICTELRYIKGLLLQGKDLALKETTVAIGPVFDLKPEIKVQGPWGGNGGGHFFDGVVTSIKKMKMKYDGNPHPCIWHIEMEYNVNGTSFVIGHGDARYGSNTALIEIDEPSEYVTQIEGWFGIVPVMVGSDKISGLTSLTIRTNEQMYGPFGGESETRFRSDDGRIMGLYGRCGMVIDQIGCFTAPAED